MKKFFIFAMLATLPFVSFADDANRMHYISVYGPESATATTNAAVDIAAYKGNATLVASWGIADASSYTGTVTLTHCATEGGTYTVVTNLAGTVGALTSTGITTNEVDTFQIDLARLHKYVKVAYTDNASDATNTPSVILVAPMKSQ